MPQSLMADGTKSINCLTSPCVKTEFVIFGFNAKLKKIKKEEITTGNFFHEVPMETISMHTIKKGRAIMYAKENSLPFTLY